MIGCDVLEPEPEPWWARRRPVATPEFLQLVVANLELWVDQARDAMTLAEAERIGLDEESVKFLLRRP